MIQIGVSGSRPPDGHENKPARLVGIGPWSSAIRAFRVERLMPSTPGAVRSPLYEADHSARYQRQALIRDYQEQHNCRLVVVRDALFPRSIPLLEETVFDANPEEDLHLVLITQGGDGETALRLIRQLQARCREFTVIVPDQAKSAGTLLVLGAHHICMGPTSDLGPVDPQFLLVDGSLASARAIIAAVERAEASVQQNPDTYPFHVSLLDPVTALMVEQARDQLARTDDLVMEALASVPGRSEEEVTFLFGVLKDPLIEAPKSHSAVISASDAQGFGLPVEEADPASSRWQAIWRLYMEYLVLSNLSVYEGQTASQVFANTPPSLA